MGAFQVCPYGHHGHLYNPYGSLSHNMGTLRDKGDHMGPGGGPYTNMEKGLTPSPTVMTITANCYFFVATVNEDPHRLEWNVVIHWVLWD